MTRQHFRALASALQFNAPDPTSPTYKAELALFTAIVKDVARVCRSNNPRFDYSRFEAACGVTQ